MKEIPLTNGKVAFVDDADYERLAQSKWHSVQYGQTWYALTTTPRPARKKVRMHRLIVSPPAGMEVDHIDGNGLNNQRHNLRICTRAENMRNIGRSSHNTSGFKGVSKLKWGRWKAYIVLNNSQMHLGCFSTAEDAARAYDAKARELFGEFARTNF